MDLVVDPAEDMAMVAGVMIYVFGTEIAVMISMMSVDPVTETVVVTEVPDVGAMIYVKVTEIAVLISITYVVPTILKEDVMDHVEDTLTDVGVMLIASTTE